MQTNDSTEYGAKKTAACDMCGRVFTRLLSQARGKKWHCSRTCSYKSRHIPLERRACRLCGVEFDAHRAETRRGGGLYCSPRCSHIANRRPLADRFWERVVKTEDCWDWTGSTNDSGYGQIQAGAGTNRPIGAHRVSWEIHNGPIPTGMAVLHRCDNPPCTNPNHLFLGSNDDNIADKIAKRRHARGSSHGNAKLTEQHVAEIHDADLSARGAMEALARRLGVTRSAIRDIRSGKNWRHLSNQDHEIEGAT